MPQDDVVRALADPACYPHHPARVEHVQTHISHVFLADGYVYKLKKEVALGFLDFSTPERRQHWCEEEIRLNGRLAPGVYLGVLPVVRGRDGRVAVGGDGEVLDHVVWMRMLPAARALPDLLRAGRVDDAVLDRLAQVLAAFHAGAPAGPDVAAYGDPPRIAGLWRDALAQAARFAGSSLPREDHALLVEFGPAFVAGHESLFRARQSAGRIREGHGDLRAEHVYVLDVPLAAPDDRAPLPPGLYVVDCVEFSRPLRCLDVASEIAFLVMDLERLSRPDLGRRFATSYAAAVGDVDLADVLPFYRSFRACVRGLVESLTAADPAVAQAVRTAAADRARAHFTLALRSAWAADGLAVLVCCGRSGTGKSTLAAALADVTGFVHLGTDALRTPKPAPDAPEGWDRGRYTIAARTEVYERLVAEADRRLAAGTGVVADGTFLRAAHRRAIADVAARHGCCCLFLVCRADDDVVRARMAERERSGGASDARWDTYVAQAAEVEPPDPTECRVDVDTGAGAEHARAAALRAAWERRRGHRPAA
jgi:aminoglycoside phosphotransferase family enzyme/predicted kinase